MDFASVANIEYAARRIRTDGIIACVGNHEYWLDADKKEVESYKAATISNLKDEWKGVPASTVRLGGANFFVFDNSFGTVTETIAAAFEETVKEGLPIVLVCHVPLWTENAGLEEEWSCGVLGRNLCDAVSCEFVERVRGEPLVRAVLWAVAPPRFPFRVRWRCHRRPSVSSVSSVPVRPVCGGAATAAYRTSSKETLGRNPFPEK